MMMNQVNDAIATQLQDFRSIMKKSTLHSTKSKQHFSMAQIVINKVIRVYSLRTNVMRYDY